MFPFIRVESSQLFLSLLNIPSIRTKEKNSIAACENIGFRFKISNFFHIFLTVQIREKKIKNQKRKIQIGKQVSGGPRFKLITLSEKIVVKSGDWIFFVWISSEFFEPFLSPLNVGHLLKAYYENEIFSSVHWHHKNRENFIL